MTRGGGFFLINVKTGGHFPTGVSKCMTGVRGVTSPTGTQPTLQWGIFPTEVLNLDDRSHFYYGVTQPG
jgi:hypothetical protein